MKRLTALKVLTGTLVLVLLASAYPLAHLVVTHLESDATGASAGSDDGIPSGSHQLPFDPDGLDVGNDDASSPSSGANPGDGSSSRPVPGASPSSSTGSALLDQVLGSARLMGHDLQVPDLPLAKLAPENPLRHALLAWIAATGADVPATELARELARADALPVDLQRDLAILILSAAEATLLQNQALSTISAADLAWIQSNPQVAQDLVAGVNSQDTLRLSTLAAQVDISKSLQATLLMLEAVEVTRGRLSNYDLQQVGAAMDTVELDPHTRALFDHLATGAGPTDAEKIRFAADLVALSTGLELDRSPLPKISFETGLEHLLASTSQPADTAALAQVLHRARLLPADLNEALGTLLAAQAGAISASNPAVATPELQAQALVDVLEAAAQALPTLEKYHHYWAGAADAMRVGQWDAEARYKWAANHAGLFASAGTSPSTIARVVGSQISGAIPVVELPERSFADALDAYLRLDGGSLSVEDRAQLADITSWIDPVALEAAGVLLSGATEASRLDREAWAGLTDEERAFLFATTDLVAQLYVKEGLTPDELAILAHHTMLSERVDGAKIAAAGAVATLAAERAAELVGKSESVSVQQEAVTLRATGWRAFLSNLMPIGTARAQAPDCVPLTPVTDTDGNSILYSNDCDRNVLLRISDPSGADGVNPDIFVLTGRLDSTQFPPTGTVLEPCQGNDCTDRTDCSRDRRGTLMCPKEVYLVGGSKVHLDLGGTDTYNMPVATTTPTAYRHREDSGGFSFGISLSDLFSLFDIATLVPPGQVSIHVDAGGGDNYYDSTALFEENPNFETYYGKFQDHPTQGSAYGGGVALLYDAGGGDFYQAGDRSQGYGRWGFGALVDGSAGDTYVGGRFVQGAGSEMLNVGVGLLLDVEGGDKYEAEQGQGFGLGGVLLDLSGHDRYEQANSPLGIPAVGLDVVPGGDLTDVAQRGDGRMWLDGPDALNVGIGLDQEISRDADEDTDDDLFPDSVEKFLGSDHEDETDTPVEAAQNRTAQASDDSDGDGWSDALERVLSTDPDNESEFPAHVPRDVGKNVPPEAGGGLAAPAGDKIIDLRLPLQDAGSIEKACATRQINGTALYTPRNVWTNNRPSQGSLLSTSPLSFNESAPDSTAVCVSVSYETTGDGHGNGTLPGLSPQYFEYDLPLGILAIGDTVATTYDVDYFFALDFGGKDKFLNGAGGALPVVFYQGGNRDNWKPTQAFAPSLALSVDRDSAGDDLYDAPRDSDRVHHAQGSLLGVLIDTNGDDAYIAGDASQGSKGGVLLDLGGEDDYAAGNLAQGAGFAQDPNRAEFGAGLEGDADRKAGQDEGVRRTAPGLLADFGDEDDTYSALAHSQGAARGYSTDCETECDESSGEFAPYSTGILYDENGADTYTAQLHSQGVGSARATGVLFDAGGEDDYTALGLVSHGATISRSYLQPAGGANVHYPALGALVDLGGANDTYEWTDGAATHSRTEQRQNQVTLTKGDATPAKTPGDWEIDSDRGIHVDTTRDTLVGTLAGTGAESPFLTSGRDLSDEDDHDADNDGDVDHFTDADRFLVNMPNARLAIGDQTPTHYTHEYAFVVDIGGDNQYNFTAAGFIGDLVARGPVDPRVEEFSAEHPVVTLFPVTFVFDAGDGTSTYRTQRSFSQGAGFFSVGILVDQAGPDTFLAQPARLPSLGSGWMSAAIIPDGNVGGQEWAGARVESLSFVGQRDSRFSKNATVRIGNDHNNLYVAVEIPLNNTAESRDSLAINLDTGHDRHAGRDDNGRRTGLDVAFVAAEGCQLKDMHSTGTDGKLADDPKLNPDDVPDLKVGCGERDGRRVYEIVKPLRATFPDDPNDVVIGFDKGVGLLETRLGLHLAVVEDVEHASAERFVWPAGTANVDGALGYRMDGELHDEMRDWAALTLANAGKSANATNATRVSPMAQGAGVGGIGLLAHLASDNSSATFVASERSQGYGAYGGIGMIYDGGSGDTYVGDRLVQAAAEAHGVGILVDAEGNDRYLGSVQSGGYANQNGAYALFSDLSGVDEYSYSGLGAIGIGGASVPGIDTDRVFDSDFSKRFPPGNQRVWFQGAGGFGVDQNSPDKQSEVVRDYAAHYLLGATKVDFEVRQVTPEGECSDDLVPQNPAGSSPRFVVRGEVCLFARVHLPDRGLTVTTESIDFLVNGIRLDLPVERPVAMSGNHVDFDVLLDASYVPDGIHTFGAVARMRLQDQAAVLLYTVPAPDLSVQVSNAPVVQVDLEGQPGYVGATDAAFSPLAATGPRALNVSWSVSHDADEDRLELFQGWSAPPELRNAPCVESDRLCNSLPFYILNEQGRLSSEPGQSFAATTKFDKASGDGKDTSLLGVTKPFQTHVDLAKTGTFYLHIADRQALQKTPLTTVVTFKIRDASGDTVIAQQEFVKQNPPQIDPAALFALSQPASTTSPTTAFDALCASVPACANVGPMAQKPASADAGSPPVAPDNWSHFVLDLNVSSLAGKDWAIVGEDTVRIQANSSRLLIMTWSIKGTDNSPIADTISGPVGDVDPQQGYMVDTFVGGQESRVRNGFPSIFSFGTADAPTRFEMRTPTEPTTLAEIFLHRLDDPETLYTLQSPTLVEGDSEGTPAACSARRCTQFVTPFTGAIGGVELADGAYRAFVNASDASGLNATVNQTFLLDRTSPLSRITTPSNVGRVLLVNGLIPVTWDVLETGESASGLHQTYLYSRAVPPTGAPEAWKLEGVYPESVRQALFSPSKDVAVTYDFLTIAEDRVGNLERLPAANGTGTTVEEALAEKELLGPVEYGLKRVTIDEAVPLVNNPRIEGGRALNYKGSDVVFVKANQTIAFKVDAADDFKGTGIGRVDVAFVYVDPVTGSILSHERNLCKDICSAGTFSYEGWSAESWKKDVFPDGIWAVLFDVYDAGSNLVRVNVGNVLLDTGSPTLEVEPVVYPPSKAAAALGDRVSLRVRGFDAFGVDLASMSADVSAISSDGVVSFRPLRVDGVIYQEASFVVDREDVGSGLHEVVVSVRDNAGNPVSEVVEVAVDVSTFEIEPETLVVTDVTHDSFTVTWNTTEPTNAYVKYGTGLLKSKTPTTADYATTHTVVVTGLDSSTGYSFRVVSATPGGYTTESDTLTVTTERALYLTGLSPEAGDAVSGIVPVRFEGGVLGADGLVTYTLEAKSAGGNYSFVTTASRRGDLHELNFNSTRYLDAANYTLRVTGEYGRETLSVEMGPFLSDNTPPTIDVLSPLQATNLTRPEIRAEVRDNLAGFLSNAVQLVIDGQNMAGVSVSPIEGEPNAFAVRYAVQDELEAGPHAFELRAVDKAGNDWVEAWDVTVDGDAPVLQPNVAAYEPGPGAGKLGGSVTLNVTVEDAGGIRSVVANTSEVSAQSATLLFRQTGTDFFIGTFELAVEETEAVRTVRVVATDLAGNEGSTFAEVVVDNAPPEANEFVTVATGHTTATVRTTSDEPVLLVGRASAPRSPAVVAETVDLAKDARLTFTGLLPSRSYDYTVTVLDRAGNSVERSGTFQTSQDSTPPGQIDGLTVTDLLNGTLRLTWRAAQDDVGVAKYRVYRSDDGVNYVPVGEVSETLYEDSGLPYERNYLYHVVAVDHGGNEGTPIEAVRASATALPRLEAGDVAPAVGSVSTTFKYSIRYVSPGGVAPAYVRIILDGVPQDMTLVGEPDYAEGALYEYATRLSPHTRGEPHTYTFEASDGRYTVRFPDAEPVRGPLVSADANAEEGSTGLANFAQNVPLGGTVGALAGIALAALAVALLIRKKKEGSK